MFAVLLPRPQGATLWVDNRQVALTKASRSTHVLRSSCGVILAQCCSRRSRKLLTESRAMMHGADVAELRSLSSNVGVAANHFLSTETCLSSMLGTIAWTGPDGDKFRADWHAEYRRALKGGRRSVVRCRGTASC
jgi:hypothetical protein